MPGHDPLHPDLLAFFTEQTNRAVKKAARRTLRQAAVGYLILFVGVMGMYWNGQHVSNAEREAVVQSGSAVVVDSCNRDYIATGRLRGIIIRIRNVIEAQDEAGKGDPEENQFAVDFYNNELKKIPLPDCRDTADALTADPDKVLKVPKPLHGPDPLPMRSEGGKG